MSNKTIALVIPSLTHGGMERVMSELANFFAQKPHLSVHLIVLTKGEKYYTIDSRVNIIQPSFVHSNYNRLVFTWKIFRFLRGELKKLNPDSILSFGGKYNAFNILANVGLGNPIYVSDRSKPGISYGKFLDFLNPITYKWTTGVVAQTIQAKEQVEKEVGHKNVRIIGNPIVQIPPNSGDRPPVILNIGRFISTKHQEDLVQVFNEINPEGWRLVFVGDGKEREKVENYANSLGISEQIEFVSSTKNVAVYYQQASIFAFTSSSEGYPNVLGEAMSSGLACISYDCVAGPADLIEHEKNGILIPVRDLKGLNLELRRMIENENWRRQLGENAIKTSQSWNITQIGEDYLNFLLAQE